MEVNECPIKVKEPVLVREGQRGLTPWLTDRRQEQRAMSLNLLHSVFSFSFWFYGQLSLGNFVLFTRFSCLLFSHLILY